MPAAPAPSPTPSTTACQTGPLPRLERGDGAAEIAFALADGRTRLARLYQRAPCRVLSPVSEPGDLPQAVLLTTSGGIANGDQLALALAAEAGATATITTQAAEKVYRARDLECARLRVTIAVAAGAYLEWLPQETILFEGARFDRRTVADIAPGGRLLACDMIAFGRHASGEHITRGFLHDGWDVRRDGRLVWRDVWRLDDAMSEPLVARCGFDGAQSIASVIYCGDDAADHVAAARAIAEGRSPLAGITLVNGVLVARWLGDSSAVRGCLMDFIARFRARAAALPARLPRVWQC